MRGDRLRRGGALRVFVILALASVPVGRAVAWPGANPFAIAVLMPVLGLTVHGVTGGQLRGPGWIVLAILTGAALTVMLVIIVAFLDWATDHRPCVMIGRICYGWDNVYVPVIASAGGLVGVLIARRRAA